MAKLEKNRLFSVHCCSDGKTIYSGIEAETAEEAISKSSRHEGQIVSQVISEPIYAASIGLETENLENGSDTGNSIFDITIRGTNEEAVNKLKEALALAIGGMAVEFADLNRDGCSDFGAALNRFVTEWGLTTNSF